MKIKKCECGCGNDAQVIHIELPQGHTYKLCKNCEIRFVNYFLSPEQFFTLLKNGHDVNEFMLHDDFYDEDTGKALQPRFFE